MIFTYFHVTQIRKIVGVSVQALYPLFCLNEQTSSCRLGVVVKTPQAIKNVALGDLNRRFTLRANRIVAAGKIKIASQQFLMAHYPVELFLFLFLIWTTDFLTTMANCRCVYETKVFLFLTL